MNYDFTLLSYVRFISGFIALSLSVILFKRIKQPGALYLILFEIAAAIWSICDGFESGATTVELKVQWSSFAYIGITGSAVFFFLFALQYTMNKRKISTGLIISLFIIPVLSIIMAFTNHSHHLLWSKVELMPGTHNGIYYYGPYFLVHVAYEYIVLFIGMIILILEAFKVFSVYKAQLWMLIIGTLLPFITSILYVFKLLPVKGIDPTPISFVVTGIVIAVSLYRYQLLVNMPFAYKQAIDNLKDGVFITDALNVILDYNPALFIITGLEKANLIGNKSDYVLEKLGVKLTDFRTEKQFTLEASICNKVNFAYFEVSYNPIIDRFKKEVGKIYLVKDITYKTLLYESISETNKKIKVQIAEKEKLISDLDAYARSVAHDLKNPITNIIGFCDIIESNIENNDPNNASNNIHIVRKQSYKMIEIINGLLMLARIRNDAMEIYPVLMEKPFNEAMFRLKNDLDDRAARIQIPHAWPEVMGNAIWIEEVWYNLINNALKYGGSPPDISAGYEILPGFGYRFWVGDNGDGLDKEALKKLFSDFERLGRKDVEGNGLGLSIVKRIINKLGGEVNAESLNQKGAGCTFSFTLKNTSLPPV